MLGVTDYVAFVAAFFVLLILPGPGTVAIISSTGKGGIKAGTAATLGIIMGDQVLLWLAVAGVAALLASHPGAFQAVQWLGAAYLAWLGGRMLLAKPGERAVLNIRPRHYSRQAAVITLLNPKAIVFYMAFFPLFVDPVNHRGMLTFSVMAITIAVMTFVYCMALVLVTHFLAERTRSSLKLTHRLEKIAGIALIGFGIKLMAAR